MNENIIEIDFTDEEQKKIEDYAGKHGLTVEETIKNALFEKIKQQGLSFVKWKEKYHKGWYLNTREQDENLFEEYLDYLKENKLNYNEVN